MKNIKYLFPMLILTLSLSQIKVLNFNINKPIGWLVLLVLSFILFSIIRHKLITAGLVLSMVIFRFIALVQTEFYLAYEIVNTILFFIAGLIVFSVKEEVFFKQILWIMLLCAPIMFLQLAGIPWVHYHTYGQELALTGGFIDTIFTPGPLSISHAQFRPPAILWSNQPMGLLIIFSVAYLFFHQRHLRWIHYFFISIVVVFSTSYFVYFAYIIILFSILVIRNKYINKRRILAVLTGSLVAIFLFVGIFPGISDILWDKYDILNKFWVRMFDLQMAGIDIYKIPFISDLEYILLKERHLQMASLYRQNVYVGEYQLYSIIGSIYRNLFFLAIFISVTIYFIIKVIVLNISNDPLKHGKLFTIAFLIGFIAINPHGDLSLFSFLIAFPLTVIFPNFINKYTTIRMVDRK